MTWVEVNDQEAPGDEGRTLAFDGQFPRYRLEMRPALREGSVPLVRLWWQFGSGDSWSPAQMVDPGLLIHLLEMLGPVPVRGSKQTFGEGSVFDPDEVRFAPEGTTLDMGEPEPFWTSGLTPGIENLEGMVELAIDNSILLGSYLGPGGRLPGRGYVRVEDDDWNPAGYLEAARRIGEGGPYEVSEAEVRFRRRCEPWFDSDRITTVVLAIIRGQPLPG